MATKGGVRASSVGSGRQNKGSNCLDTSTGAAIHKCAWPCAGKQIEQNTLPPPHHLPHHRKYIASSTFSEQSQLRPTNLQKKRSLPSKIYLNTLNQKSDFNSNGIPKQKTLSPTMFQEASNQLSKKNEILMDLIRNLLGGVGNI